MSAAPTAAELRRAATEFRRLAETMEAGAAYSEAREQDFAKAAAPILLAPATPASSDWTHSSSDYAGRTLHRHDRARGTCTYRASAMFGARPRYRHPTRWEGQETLFDSAGRVWTRLFEAVIDDFGDLVEVAA